MLTHPDPRARRRQLLVVEQHDAWTDQIGELVEKDTEVLALVAVNNGDRRIVARTAKHLGRPCREIERARRLAAAALLRADRKNPHACVSAHARVSTAGTSRASRYWRS